MVIPTRWTQTDSSCHLPVYCSDPALFCHFHACSRAEKQTIFTLSSL
jgi:hypothetical protein